jgi:hypothetical protein
MSLYPFHSADEIAAFTKPQRAAMSGPRTTAEQLAEVARLEAKATPGPWEHGGGRQIFCKPGGDYVPARTTEDALFIVAARTLLPAVAADLADLRAAVRALIAASEGETAEQIAERWYTVEDLVQP